MSPATLQASRRPLTAAEQRLVQSKIRRLRARAARASARYVAIAGGVVFVLWLATLVASDASWPVVTLFWIVAGGAIMLWVRGDARKDARQQDAWRSCLESALRRNEADVYDIRAGAFAEIEEIEDEGACYAFEVDAGRLVFITGQQFYEGARFPSLDFSLVYLLDEAGQPVDMVIDKRGPRATAARKVPAAIKQKLDVPDHLEVRVGHLDDLEHVLGPSVP